MLAKSAADVLGGSFARRAGFAHCEPIKIIVNRAGNGTTLRETLTRDTSVPIDNVQLRLADFDNGMEEAPS